MTKPIELTGASRQGGKTFRMLQALQEALEIKAVAYLPCIDVGHARLLTQLLGMVGGFKYEVSARRPLGQLSTGSYRKRNVYILVSKI